MAELMSTLLSTGCARLGLVLTHFIWEGAVVALLLAALLRFLRNRSPRARYTACTIAMVIMAAAPAVTWLILDATTSASRALARASDVDRSNLDDQAAEAEAVLITMVGLAGENSMADADEAPGPAAALSSAAYASSPPAKADPSGTSQAIKVGRIMSPHRLESALALAALCWAGGVFLLTVRLVIGWVGLHRLRRRNPEPLPEAAESIFRSLCGRLGLVGVQARVTHVWREPVVFGLLRPLILIPASALSQCPPALLEALIAHELAHIRRYDLWVNLFQRIVETLLFYQPAVWWVSGRMRLERELCCDDLSVGTTHRRAEYAAALVEVSRLTSAAQTPALAAGLGARISLMARARRVLQLPADRPGGPRIACWVAGPVVLLLAAGVALVVMNSSLASPASPASRPAAAYPPDLFRPPPESMTFVFDWKDTPFDDAIAELSELAGLSVRGLVQIPAAERPLAITFKSVRFMAFDEALLLFDRLIEDDGFWVVRRDDFLDIKRITEYYRFIPPSNRFDSLSSYRQADLPEWEVASVLYEPRDLPVRLLAEAVVDSVPNNVARAKIALDNRRVELQGIVYYINMQLELLVQLDKPTALAPASQSATAINSRHPLDFARRTTPSAVDPRVQTATRDGKVSLYSLTEGVITRVYSRSDGPVKKGELVLELDNAEIHLELKAAELRLRSAVDELASLRSILGSPPKRASKPVSVAEVSVAERAVELAKLEVERWALRLERTQFRSPVDGSVYSVYIGFGVSEGRRVSPGDVVAVITPDESLTRPAEP